MNLFWQSHPVTEEKKKPRARKEVHRAISPGLSNKSRSIDFSNSSRLDVRYRLSHTSLTLKPTLCENPQIPLTLASGEMQLFHHLMRRGERPCSFIRQIITGVSYPVWFYLILNYKAVSHSIMARLVFELRFCSLNAIHADIFFACFLMKLPVSARRLPTYGKYSVMLMQQNSVFNISSGVCVRVYCDYH